MNLNKNLIKEEDYKKAVEAKVNKNKEETQKKKKMEKIKMENLRKMDKIQKIKNQFKKPD